MLPSPSRDEARGLYRPTPDETVNACETLLCADLPREARTVAREILERTETDHVEHRA